MQERSLVPLTVHVVETEFRSQYDPSQIRKNPRMMRILAAEAATDRDRNLLVLREIYRVLSEGDHRIIGVFESLEQCTFLDGLISEMYDDGVIKGEIFTGAQKKLERREMVRRMNEGETNLLLTVKLAGMGLDIPEADVLVFDQHISDPLSVEQIVGRVVRACPRRGKTHGTVIDFHDQYTPSLENQLRRRIAVYNKFLHQPVYSR